jgi:hypothetical protein
MSTPSYGWPGAIQQGGGWPGAIQPQDAGGGFQSYFAIGCNPRLGAMQKNVSGQKIGAQLVSATDGSAFTGSVTVAVTGDAGTQATGSVGSGACAHEGNGYHTYAPAQAETNYDLIAFTFTGTGAVPVTVQMETRHDANVTHLGGSTTPVTNLGTVFNTDFATNYDATNDRWSVGVAALAANVLTAAAIASDAITAAKIATGAIAATKFAAGAIDAAAIDNSAIDALLDRSAGVETNRTLRQALRLILAVAAGKTSGMATTTGTIRDTNDTVDRVVATVDADGNRSSVTLNAG